MVIKADGWWHGLRGTPRRTFAAVLNSRGIDEMKKISLTEMDSYTRDPRQRETNSLSFYKDDQWEDYEGLCL